MLVCLCAWMSRAGIVQPPRQRGAIRTTAEVRGASHHHQTAAIHQAGVVWYRGETRRQQQRARVPEGHRCDKRQ